ncbi:MAG: hypothetical protein IVW54_22575 [Candidatus Binataceae bacterium]|nr:hypothetical protein [Candidatus Binataceae bacterium]
MINKLIYVLRNNAQAVIIAIGLVIAGFLWGGVYTTCPAYKGMAVYRVNRLTGAVALCIGNQPCKDEEMATPTP